jgi:hypothetical protein
MKCEDIAEEWSGLHGKFSIEMDSPITIIHSQNANICKKNSNNIRPFILKFLPPLKQLQRGKNE